MTSKTNPVDDSVKEVEKAVSQEQEQGYRGVKVDPLPNSAHSLESGPDSPTAAEQRAALAQQED